MAMNWNSFIEDLVGIFKTPGQTLGKLMKSRNWVPMFLILVIIMGLVTYFTFPAKMAQMAKDPRYAEIMGGEKAPYFVNNSTFARTMGTFTSVFVLFVTLVMGAFFLYLFFGIGGSDGLFNNYFTLVVHASVIDVVIPLLLSSLSIVTGIGFSAVATPFNLILSPDPKSFIFLVLGALNIFTLWYHVVVAAGIHVFSNLSFKKCMTISILYFLFKAVVSVGFSYIAMKIMGF